LNRQTGGCNTNIFEKTTEYTLLVQWYVVAIDASIYMYLVKVNRCFSQYVEL